MASIQTGIELQDNFTSVMYGIIDSVNLTISAMYDMQQSMNADIDTGSLESARDEINEVTAAINEMQEAALNQTAPDIAPPVNAGSSQVINVDAQPIIPDPLVENPQPIRPEIQPNAPPEPVQVPVQWQTDGLEVFTNTGAERFQQEIQSANAMLEQLANTQNEIRNNAITTNVLPFQAVQNISDIGHRLQGIRDSIQEIENNPMNLGIDTANAELEQLRSQLNRAVQEQNELNAAMRNMDVSAANNAYLRLSQTVSGTERYIRDNTNEQGRFNQEIQSGVSNANTLVDSIKGAVAAYASIQTVGQIINLSDTMTQTTARLNLIVDDGGSVEELQNKIYASAQNARGSYQETADAVSKLGMQASQAFSSNDELIAFTELLNKQFVNAGTSAQGIDSVMLQLTQSMAAGKLQGEELNAVMDNAAPIVQDIQQYLEEVQGIDASNIKQLASEGQITADIIKSAMFYAADDINSQFESMPMTWRQNWEEFSNAAQKAFTPVLEYINNLANSPMVQEFLNGAIEAMATLASVTLDIFDLIGQIGTFIIDNWSIIEPIIWGVIGALAVYNAVLKICNGIQVISNGLAAISKARALMQAGATFMQAAATETATGKQLGFNAALLACPLTWIIMLIIALIALFYVAVAAVNKFAGTSYSATGIIAGAVATLVSFLINKILMMVNYCISVAEFFANVWNHPIYSVKKLFVSLASVVLDFAIAATSSFDEVATNLANAFVSGANLAIKSINWIIDAINKIPGVNIDKVGEIGKVDSITSSLTGVKDNLNNWLGEAPEDYKSFERIDYINLGDAWDTGYTWGAGIENAISNFSLSDVLGKVDIPNPDDYTNSFDDFAATSGISDSLGSIAGDTGGIRDSLNVTQEELKYLRDIAEQESTNRFTTAELTINQTNNNNISSDMDLDGFIDKLDEAMGEAIDIVTEGGTE